MKQACKVSSPSDQVSEWVGLADLFKVSALLSAAAAAAVRDRRWLLLTKILRFSRERQI